MNAIFVTQDFENVVDTFFENAGIPVRLGGRLVDNGEHAGKLFVNCDLFNSSPEWAAITQGYITGGTALSESGIDFSAGKTLQFTDAFETVWEFTIYEIINPNELFNETEEEPKP